MRTRGDRAASPRQGRTKRPSRKRPLVLDNSASFFALQIERHREEHDAGDPFALWRAVFYVQFLGSIPPWILESLNKIGERLLQQRASSVDDEGKVNHHWTEAIAEALGFTMAKTGGPSNPFRRSVHQAALRLLAMRVRIHIDAGGQNETDAIYLVAEQQCVSRSTVRRAWKEHGPAIRRESLRDVSRAIEAPSPLTETLLFRTAAFLDPPNSQT